MRLSLLNQPEIETLSMALAQSLRALIAAIQTGWNRQHKGDGTHTDVTADSLVVTGVAQLGRVRLGNIVDYVNNGIIAGGRLDNLTTGGIQTAAVLKIQIAQAGVSISGIDASGRQKGDLLLVINNDQVVATPQDFSLAVNDTNSLIGNRIFGSLASVGPWTVNGSQGVWLMYDDYTNAGQTPILGWRVLDRA